MSDLSPELLVTRGLLPENLPPVFTTKNIWPALSALGDSYSITQKIAGDHPVFNASKRGGQRRLFSIPHPLFLRDKSIFFALHWNDIVQLFEASPGSASKPNIDSNGPRYIRIHSHHDLPKIRLTALSKFKYCLVTDVSRFFPSIYTHSIPWAVNTKAAAKKDFSPNSKNVWGNKLDFICRQSQSGQTIGIPIGPDTSKIISEIIMSAVDGAFIALSGKSRPVYVRHVDDYWIGGNSHEECEKHLRNLRSALKQYELDINETKTKIISAKYIFGEAWPYELEKEICEAFSGDPSRSKKANSNSMSVLGKVIDRASNEGDDGIIRHIIRIADENRLWNSNWEILEHFLAQCAVQFPHSFDYVARVLAWRIRTVGQVNSNMWVDISRETIMQAAPLGRDSEVIWALWLLKELKYKIPKDISDAILPNNGSIVLSFLAHFAGRKMASDRNLKIKLRQIVEGNPYSGTYWPLTLELTHLGLGDANWKTEGSVASIRCLHDAAVSIINWDALPRVFVKDSNDEEMPEHAIEDYGSDYGRESDDDSDDDFGGFDDDGDSDDSAGDFRGAQLDISDFMKIFGGNAGTSEDT